MISQHLCRYVSVLYLNFVLDERLTHYSLLRPTCKSTKKTASIAYCCNFLSLELMVSRGTIK